MVAGLFKSLQCGLCGVGKLAGLPFQAHISSASHAAAPLNNLNPRKDTVNIAMVEATIDVLGGESFRGHVLGLEKRARR